MEETIVKLINSGNKEDIIIGMHLLGQYTWEEIVKFIKKNFTRYNDRQYEYEECSVVVNFVYDENVIYVGASLLTIDPRWKIHTDIEKIIIR